MSICLLLNRYVTHNRFTVFCIREANADRLVNEEDVRFFVPRIRIERCGIRACNPTRTCTRFIDVSILAIKRLNSLAQTELHEKAK